MPVPPKSLNVGSEEKEKNRKVMVTMIDGGLPVVAVSKREKAAKLTKNEKNKVKSFRKFNSTFILSLARFSHFSKSINKSFLLCVTERTQNRIFTRRKTFSTIFKCMQNSD
jgi:hypothetical protein